MDSEIFTVFITTFDDSKVPPKKIKKWETMTENCLNLKVCILTLILSWNNF